MILSQLVQEFDTIELDPLKVYEEFMGDGTYILESAEGGEKIARYSILGLKPALKITVKDGKTKVEYANKQLKEFKV